MTPLLSTAILRTQSDRRLVALARGGHEAAFEAIVERYRGQLRRYCVRLLPDGPADDALQHTFLLAWTALQDGREVRELRPWLYAVAHNAAVTQLRRGVFDYVELLDTLEGHGGTEADVERRSVMRQTLAAVAALPARQRDALLAVALEGRPQAEVAVEMGLTDNGLRQLLFRARSAVRAAATAITPIPVLVWAVRAGAVAGGATAVPAGTALVVAGTLAVGGAVGLRTPVVPQRTPQPPLVAATPAAGPVAGRAHNAAAHRTGARAVHVRRTSATGATRPRHPARVVALRGARGVRVTAHGAPRAVEGAPPRFVSTTVGAPAGPPQPAVVAAPAAQAAPAQPGEPAAAAAPAADQQPAAPAVEEPALPRAHRDDDEDDDGHDDADTADGPLAGDTGDGGD